MTLFDPTRKHCSVPKSNSSLEAKLQSVTAESEEKIKLLTLAHTEKYNALQDKYITALEKKSKLVVDMTSYREVAERFRRESTLPRSRPTPYRGPNDRVTPRRANIGEGPYIPQPTLWTITIPSTSALSLDWGNLRVPFPTQAASWTTLEHSGFRPSRDFALVIINWAAYNGVGKSSAYVNQCIATNTLPKPTVFPPGESIGLQVIPTTRGDLRALISRAATSGNVGDLLHLRFAYTLVEYLDQGTGYAPNIDLSTLRRRSFLERCRLCTPHGPNHPNISTIAPFVSTEYLSNGTLSAKFPQWLPPTLVVVMIGVSGVYTSTPCMVMPAPSSDNSCSIAELSTSRASELAEFFRKRRLLVLDHERHMTDGDPASPLLFPNQNCTESWW
ncbi:hypothetical protein AAF712_005689 [Marasmius tenuissimus]|uniref:Uncharacterized protein n=1 Tax=Marasmius tenuissimus TaxID=585030 RepID=A0ABR3A1R2_9AGAR